LLSWTLRWPSHLAILALRRSPMARVIVKGAVLLLVLGAGLGIGKLLASRNVSVASQTTAPVGTLQEQINDIYKQSVAECAVSYPGDSECVKTQFLLNYRWRFVDDSTGPPGAPGPVSGDEPRASTPKRAQRTR
jgi:hypothetical protein